MHDVNEREGSQLIHMTLTHRSKPCCFFFFFFFFFVFFFFVFSSKLMKKEINLIFFVRFLVLERK